MALNISELRIELTPLEEHDTFVAFQLTMLPRLLVLSNSGEREPPPLYEAFHQPELFFDTSSPLFPYTTKSRIEEYRVANLTPEKGSNGSNRGRSLFTVVESLLAVLPHSLQKALSKAAWLGIIDATILLLSITMAFLLFYFMHRKCCKMKMPVFFSKNVTRNNTETNDVTPQIIYAQQAPSIEENDSDAAGSVHADENSFFSDSSNRDEAFCSAEVNDVITSISRDVLSHISSTAKYNDGTDSPNVEDSNRREPRSGPKWMHTH
eukprot:TRINITY_DN29547_c0_g1_i3.p1 TRINITY_DN29547_c0_g1~~TRINITY_DN29547_c0_g1_i3.p1  ORF type:complete len:306 (+),score=26.80 TRINITY_DN29547_c0_g1_i3:124-918(+)